MDREIALKIAEVQERVAKDGQYQHFLHGASPLYPQIIPPVQVDIIRVRKISDQCFIVFLPLFAGGAEPSFIIFTDGLGDDAAGHNVVFRRIALIQRHKEVEDIVPSESLIFLG